MFLRNHNQRETKMIYDYIHYKPRDEIANLLSNFQRLHRGRLGSFEKEMVVAIANSQMPIKQKDLK